MSEVMFEDIYEQQEWYDIGADLRIKIRKQFSDLRKYKDAEIEKLQAEINRLNLKYDYQHLVKENDKLKAEVAALKKELEDVISMLPGDLE